MTKLFMMVGLPGSGKSTRAEELAISENATIFSSDKYREKKFGSAEILGDKAKLFEEIHNDAIAFLKDGKNVILDATNLTYKSRKGFLDKISKLEVDKICILLATQYEHCLDQNNDRERVVPEHVIKRMRESFQAPTYAEGWDKIEIKYVYYNEGDEGDYHIEDYLNRADVFDQKNHHHTMTLGGHSRKVAEFLEKENELLYWTGLIHDNGKLETQVFTNMKGEPSDVCHYYGHESVGAYESLFYSNEHLCSTEETLYVAGLITYHMRPYMNKTQKSQDKLKNTIGEKMYNDLMKLHEADKRSK